MSTGDTAYIAGVDTPTLEATPDVLAEGVIADFGDKGDAVTKSRGSHGDISRASTDRLVKTLLVVKPRVGLLRIEVDANPTDADDLNGHGVRDSRVGATVSTRYCMEVVTWWIGPSPSAGKPSVIAVSCSITYQPSYPARSSVWTTPMMSTSP